MNNFCTLINFKRQRVIYYYRIEKTKELIAELMGLGVTVQEKPGMHEHFAVIDREIVWYGSVNLLSNAKEEDNLMRVKSKEIAQELLEIGFL